VGRKPKKENTEYYFGDQEEEFFLTFINSNDPIQREIIYNKYLKEPFQRMVESILRRYPIHIGNYEIDEVEKNGLSHLIENMVKFDPTRLSKSGKKVKAFSYCQTIVRNYFRDHGRKSYHEKTTNLNYDDHSNEVESRDEYMYEIDVSEDNKMLQLIQTIVRKIKDQLVVDKSLKKNEIIIGEAIVNVLENWDLLFLEDTKYGKYNKKITNNYTKNKILLLLKEQTQLSTKDIRIAMKQFKDLYAFTKKSFFNEENDENEEFEFEN